MSNMKTNYTQKAYRAANSAAAKVFADALLHNRPFPVWKNGKVEYKLPTQEEIDNSEAPAGTNAGDEKITRYQLFWDEDLYQSNNTRGNKTGK